MNIAKMNETAKVIQMPGTERKRNSRIRNSDPLIANFNALPLSQQQVWRNVLEFAALANKKGHYPGLPYLIGGDEKVFGKSMLAGFIPGGVPVLL